jgi:hypothetical protein
MPKIRTHYDDIRCFCRTANSVNGTRIKTKCMTESCAKYNDGSGKRYCPECLRKMGVPLKKVGVINNLCS